MKVFILWALLSSGRWTPIHTSESLGTCNETMERYNADKELKDRGGVIRFVCLPPQVKPGKLSGA